jgi:hypothetical protein
MFHHPRWLRHAALVAVLVTAMFSSGGRASTTQGTEGTVRLGPVGVAQDEALRLTIYAPAETVYVQWDFVVRIFNTRGEVALERRFTLAPGVTRSVDVNIGNPDIFPVETLGRRTLRAEIKGFNPQPDPPGKFVATLETYSIRTGATGIVLGETFIGDEEN